MKRILVVGCIERCNNEVVVDALRSRGFDVDYTEKVKVPDVLKLRSFDVVYGVHLQTCSRYVMTAEMLGRKTIIHFVGSDAYRYARERGLRKLFWRSVIGRCDQVLYVSPHLMKLVGRQGSVLPLPIRIDLFKKSREDTTVPKRDVLYFCPGGSEGAKTYRRDWIVDYARSHPEEKITIIGNSISPADRDFNMPNVEVVPYVPYDRMGEVYARHRKLIRMTTQDGLPRMVSEALLSGLEVIFNGRNVTDVPSERDPEVFAQRFEEELLRIL